LLGAAGDAGELDAAAVELLFAIIIYPFVFVVIVC
jgi:hypothetical protein